MAKVRIPSPLRKFTNNLDTLETSASNITGAISELVNTYPKLKEQIIDSEGKIRKFVRIYLGDTDIKALDNENTPVKEDSVVNIIPAIAGGR